MKNISVNTYHQMISSQNRKKTAMKHLTDDEYGIIILDVINKEYHKKQRYACYEDKQLILTEQNFIRLLDTNYQEQYMERYLYLLSRKAKRDYENFKRRRTN